MRSACRGLPSSAAGAVISIVDTASPATLPGGVARPTAPRRIAGLDGLRALAVLAVMVYHFIPAALPGGYIGVDVFFVLSGFLITTILLREHAARGTVSLRHFWLHRARRLVPALVAVVLICVAAVALAVAILQIRGEPVSGSPWGDLLVGVGAQLAAAATFTSNWLTVAVGQSYAAAGSPHLFGNLWSLAVEEQFYLVWPLVVLAVLGAGVAMRRAAWGAGAVALASAGAMAILLPAAGDPTRVYVGTDTHAFGLMLGAALAFGWRARQQAGRAHSLREKAWSGVAALVGAGVLVWLATTMSWDSSWTYRGGLLVASLATAALIHGLLVMPRLGRVLDVQPMRWLGERSYGLYLWHWPVLVILVTGFDGGNVRAASGLTVALAATLSLVAAAVSYRWLEMPVRRMGFRRALRALVDWLYPTSAEQQALQAARRRRAAVFGGTVAGVLALAGSAVAYAPEQTSLEMQLEQGAVAAADGDLRETDVIPPVTADAQGARHESVPAPSVVAAPTDVVPPGKEITMIGDSVMLGSAGGLTEALPGVKVEAEVGRQFATGAERVQALQAKDKLRPYLVVGLGTNGIVTDALVDQMVAAAGDRPVVMVTAYGDRSWMPSTNEAIRKAPKRHPNVVVADWDEAVRQDTSVIGSDGIHPNGRGVDLYVAVVEQGLKDATSL